MNVYYAAKNGSLQNTKWFKKNGCPWNEMVFLCAAKNGSLENMKWLRESGCPWDEGAFTCAVRHGVLGNIKWLQENGCPMLNQIYNKENSIRDGPIKAWMQAKGYHVTYKNYCITSTDQ